MKSIPGFPNYSITKDGRVWSTPRRRTKGGWLKLINRVGYLAVELFKNSQGYICYLHRLVLETFVGACPAGMQCRHLNGIRTDNRLENLCWGTYEENEVDKERHGLTAQGEKNGNAKLTKEKVKVIRYLHKVAKFTYADLAWQFDVYKSTIERIVNRKTWKHLDAKV